MAPRAVFFQEEVRDIIRGAHPQTRRKVWAAIDVLRLDPFAGRALHRELAGLWRFPVGRLRIVYRFDARRLEVSYIGPRATVYEDLARRLRSDV